VQAACAQEAIDHNERAGIWGGVDLADARQQWPQLDALWDAVRRQLWRELVPPPRRRGPHAGRQAWA
jgi:hypothetical protein